MNTDETTAPPGLPKENGPSFYHKAAKYAVLVIVITFCVNLAAQISIPNTGPVNRIISLLGGIMFLSAIPAGIIALVGVRKYGCRYLLWRGLVGILVPALLIGMAVPAFLKVRSLAGTAQIQSIAKSLNEGAPKMVDDITRLDKATVGPGKVLTIDITITSMKAADIDRDAWKTQAMPNLKAGILTSPLSKVLSAGNTLIYRYKDSEGALIDELSLTQHDLPSK